MRKFLFVLLLCTLAVAGRAQRISRQYNNVSMAEALKELNLLQDRYVVNFIYDDLEDFRVTTTVRGRSVPDAVGQIIGFYPVRMTQRGDMLMVECTHRTQRHLTGRVVDEQGEAVPFANVLLLSAADSAVIAGGVTNESGVFVVPYEPLKVIARVSYVGYQTVWRTYHSEQAGTIRLQPETRTLKAVDVKALRPQYRMTKGGMGVTVENTLLSDAGTAQDVLALLPRVNVDADNNVTVFAKGSPDIYINNKRVESRQDLTQLKSADIKSVDVITSPGAQYNATVRSVIRIHTKKAQGDGFSFRADNNVKYNLWWTGFQEDYVKYRRNGLEVFADGYISTFSHQEKNHVWQDIRGTDHLFVDQHLLSIDPINTLYGKAGCSYDFDADHSVGASYNVSKEFNPKASAEDATQDIWRNGTLEGHVAQTMDVQTGAGPSHEANAYYVGKWGQLGIDLNATYLWNKHTQRMYETEQSAQVESRTVHTHSEQRNRLWAGKLILTCPVGKGSLSWGAELSDTYSKGQYTNDEGYVPASLTEVKERNIAGFAEYETAWGSWSLGGGLRYEHAKSDYYSFGRWQEGPSRRYGNWFPSLSASWQKGLTGIQLSYTCKTARPNYHDLRDNIDYNNRYFYEGGNPYLTPTVIHSVDFSLTRSWLNISAGYTYYKDNQEWCVTLFNRQDIALSTTLNFPHKQNVYASIVASPKFGCYQPSFEVDYSQQFFNVEGYGDGRSLNRPGFVFSVQNRFTFPHDLMAMVNFRHNTRQYSGFMRSGHTTDLSIQVTKSLCHKAWTLSLKLNDLLKTQRDAVEMYVQQLVLGKDAYDYTRRASFTVTYNFNATRSKYKGTGAGNAEKKRL